MKRGLTNLKLMYLGTVMAFFSSVGIFSELTEKASCVCGFFFFLHCECNRSEIDLFQHLSVTSGHIFSCHLLNHLIIMSPEHENWIQWWGLTKVLLFVFMAVSCTNCTISCYFTVHWKVKQQILVDIWIQTFGFGLQISVKRVMPVFCPHFLVLQHW